MSVDYLLRYSKRAKYLQLRITPAGLEVVVPSHNQFPSVVIEQFIREKEPWIKRTQQRYLQTAECKNSVVQLPSTIHFQMLNEIWNVKYLQTHHPKIMLVVNQTNEVSLIGNIKNENVCIKKLKAWVFENANIILRQSLDMLSMQTELHYDKFSIRNNSSRWGSCSNKRNISLCCKLIFLPEHLVRHVLLHELCHTKVMNHGNKFWKLLQRFDPEAKAHAKELKVAGNFVPLWMNRR